MTKKQLQQKFTNNLNTIIYEYGISLKELSKITGICSTTLSKYTNGILMPTVTNLINLSIALDCDITDLIDNDEKIM